MIKSVYIALFCFLLLSLNHLFAQESVKEKLDFDTFIEVVYRFHPIAQQARLNPEMGESTVRAARGGFDPRLFTNIGEKYFENDQYYSLIDAGFKIPTWFGLELYGGIEQNNGVNLNPERKTHNAGLAYAGVSLSVGQGLFIDQRRADLRKAQLFEKMSHQEQRVVLNDVLLGASNAYWDWFAAYQVVEVFEEALRLANERFEGVKSSALQGESPIIDTVEAHIQVENREISLQEARLNFQNKTAALSVFLWGENSVPLEVEENVIPEDKIVLSELIKDEEINQMVDSLVNNHPVMLQQQLYLDQLEIERRWRAEQLKPVVNLKYNALNEPIGNNVVAGYSINNFTWGLGFYMPVFLRRERGQLQLTKLKIRDASLGLENLRENLFAEVNIALNDWRTTTNQVGKSESVMQNSEVLLKGEQRKFEIGESSLFMVNAREVGFIESQIAFARFLASNRKALIRLNYQLGVLSDRMVEE